MGENESNRASDLPFDPQIQMHICTTIEGKQSLACSGLSTALSFYF